MGVRDGVARAGRRVGRTRPVRSIGRSVVWLQRHGGLALLTAPVALVALLAGLDGSSHSKARKHDGVLATGLGEVAQRALDILVPGRWDVSFPRRRWVVAILLGVAALAGIHSCVRAAATQSVLARASTLVLALAGSWSFVLAVPAIMAPEVNGRWASVALAAVAGALSIKLLLLFRASSAFAFTPPRSVTLLSNQQRAMDALRPGRDEHASGARRFEIKQLTGDWGTGKSYVVHALKAEFHRPPQEWRRRPRTERTAIVCIDIWKHDSEVDLHRALVGEILGHPACQLPFGWMRYPVLGTLAAYVRNFVVTLPIGANGSVEVPVTLPRLSWQRPLERTVVRLARRRIRLLVVLDELDRASALVAQAALSMVHRSLDLPGVNVVLVHVPEIVESKGFNPLFAAVPDLRSNATAQVLRVTEALAAAGDTGAAERWEEIREAIKAPHESSSDAVSANVLDTAAAHAFAGLEPRARRRIMGALSEKFLRPVPVTVGPLGPTDVGRMLAWPGVAEALDQTALRELRSGAQWPAVLDLVERAVRRWQMAPLIPAAPGHRVVGLVPIPPIRRLKSALEELIGASGHAGFGEMDLALCVVMALETCRFESGGTAVEP